MPPKFVIIFTPSDFASPSIVGPFDTEDEGKVEAKRLRTYQKGTTYITPLHAVGELWGGR